MTGTVQDKYAALPGTCEGCGEAHGDGGSASQPGRADELNQLRADNADYRALFDVQWDRMAEATARWRSESPDLRALIMPDLEALLTWLMGQADDARRNAAREILAHARTIEADMDGDPDLAADPMIAGEVEGLWSAVRIADRETWREARGDG